MIPLALVLMQTQTVALTPFLDDGETKLPPTPIILPLAKGGGRQTATLPGGAKAWIAGGKLFLVRGGKPTEVPLRRMDTTAPDGKSVMIYMGQIALGATERYSARFFLSDTKAPQFEPVRGKLALLPLFGFTGIARLGGKAVKIGVRGLKPADGALVVDRDGDGRLGSVPMEGYSLGSPFNIGGTTYRVSSYSPAARRVVFSVSSKKVAEVPLPPDLRVGRVVPSVPGKTLGGKAVTFPKSFPGKIVMLDVWATWCGPCRGEFPFMRAAYAKYRNRGFEIVSMSIDDPGTQAKVAAFTKANGMVWTQVFQGQSWQSPVCRRYNITSIPFVILVDGTTGKILATEESLRGPNLDPTVQGLLSLRGR